MTEGRTPPELFSEAERKEILADAEALWRDLQENNLGGFSGANRPFYILHEFKRIIEKYGNRDVGLKWSKNDLDALSVAKIDSAIEAYREGVYLTDEQVRKSVVGILRAAGASVPEGSK